MSISLSTKLLRGKSKIISLSLILIMLSTSLVVSILLTADYLTYASAREKYLTLPVDYYATVTFANKPYQNQYKSIQAHLSGLKDVIAVHYMYDSCIYKVDINDTTKSRVYRIEEIGSIILGFDFSDSFWRQQVILGNNSKYPTEFNEILLDISLAEWMNISIGDQLHIKRYDATGEYEDNLTVVGYFKSGEFLNYHLKNIEEMIYWGVFVTNIETAMKLMGSLYTTPVFQFRYHVWVNRDNIINAWDEVTTMKNINAIQVEISKILYGTQGIFRVDVESPLQDIMRDYFASAKEYGSQLVFIVVLVLVFVALATLIGGELSVETRRREFGLLKIRGGKSSVLSRIISIEWFIIGLFGGLLGFILSPILGYIITFIVSPSFAVEYNFFIVILPIIEHYFVTSLVIGLALTILSVILPSRRVSQIKPLDAIREYAESEELSVKAINRKVNFSLVVIGGYFLGDFILGLPVINQILNFAHLSGVSILINLSEILYFIEITIMPLLAPFIMAMGLVNIIVSFSDQLAGVFRIIVKPLTGRGSIVAARNFARKPLRTSLIIFMLTFTIIANLTLGSGIATVKNHIIVDTKMQVGADIKVEIYSLRPFDFFNRTIVTPINKYPGVKHVTRGFIEAFSGPYLLGKIHLVALDPIYFKMDYYKDAYLSGVTVNEAYNLLLNNYTIINYGAAKRYNLSMNDIISVRDPIHPSVTVVNYKIGGYYKFLPGVFQDMLAPQVESGIYAVINLDTIWRILEERYVVVVPDKTFLFIELENGVSAEQVAAYIRNLLTEYQIDGRVFVLNDEIDRMLHKEFSGALLSLYETGLLFSSTLIALVVFVSITISIIERRRELALLRVRGFMRNMVSKMLLGEAFLVMIVSLIISIPLSILMISSWVSGTTMVLPYLQRYLQVTGGVVYPPEWALFILPIDIVSYLLAILVIFALSYIIPYRLISKKPLPEEVRIYH